MQINVIQMCGSRGYIDQSPLTTRYDSGLEIRARDYFRVLHKKQVRKYTEIPYFVHLEEVANLVRSVPHTSAMVAAGYGHDSIEDQNATVWRLASLFGNEVAEIIDQLSTKQKLPLLSRAVRKQMERERLALLGEEIQTIKVCDIISNTRLIAKENASFAKVYLPEQLELLNALTKANQSLLNKAHEQVSRELHSLQ